MSKLIVGLGNPGEKYKNTRHNLGFMVVDKIVEDLISSRQDGTALGADERRGKGEGKEAIIYHQECRNAKSCVFTIWAVKPQTYINNSGQVVKKLADYYKIKTENIIVIHDDLDLKLGRIKIQKGRGSAGHKGVQSTIDFLGANDFTRVRLGIGRPPAGIEPDDFVLQNFDKTELSQVEGMISEAVSLLKNLIFQE